ncbi:MAG TPA: hypothetical protein VGW57_01100 [Chthoniobacterales bacterium]|nr:hypothetical protein [Chthoniobacterales bacterium]
MPVKIAEEAVTLPSILVDGSLSPAISQATGLDPSKFVKRSTLITRFRFSRLSPRPAVLTQASGCVFGPYAVGGVYSRIGDRACPQLMHLNGIKIADFLTDCRHGIFKAGLPAWIGDFAGLDYFVE